MNSRKAKVAFEEPRPDDVGDDEEDFEEEVYEDEDDLDEGDEEEEEEEEDDDEMEIDMNAMDETLASYFTTEDGDNVATALMTISDNVQNLTKVMETQNKILIKLATQLAKK